MTDTPRDLRAEGWEVELVRPPTGTCPNLDRAQYLIQQVLLAAPEDQPVFITSSRIIIALADEGFIGTYDPEMPGP